MRRLLLPVLVLGLPALSQEIQELRLGNGLRVLKVDRPGTGAVCALLAFRGGSAEESGPMVGATALLARSLYGATPPEAAEEGEGAKALDTLLAQEEAQDDSLRLALRRQDSAEDLKASLAALTARRQALLRGPEGDLYAPRGIRLEAAAEADLLRIQFLAPKGELPFLLATEAKRLRRLALPRFTEDRAALLKALVGAPPALTLLAGAALPGHPYGRDPRIHRGSLEALRRSDLRTYARTALGPDRALLVLVGDLQGTADRELLERTLGSLPVPEVLEPVLPELPLDLGERRLQATASGAASLLMGWRVPAARHGDHLALKVLSAAWCDPGGILARRLVQEKGLARKISGGLHAPGGRLHGLLWVEAQPAEGVNLQALEAALSSEALRLQQELLDPEAWKTVVRRMELSRTLRFEDPQALVEDLARAWVQEGDWQRLVQEGEKVAHLGPEAVQGAARRHLAPAHRTVAHLEEDPLAAGDPLDPQLAELLRKLASRRIQDPYQIETMIQEGLRQIRMLPKEERERTLRLLKSQLEPGVRR